MGFWSRLFGMDSDAPGPTFAIDASAVPPELFGLTSYETAITPESPVSRSEAMQVPAVIRIRQMICGTLGRLPLYAMNAATYERDFSRTLLNQPERDFPRSVTMAMTVEDMLFHGRAWWRVTERDFTGRPVRVRRLDASTVGITPEGKVYIRSDGSSQGVAYEYPQNGDLIRFDSLHPDGLLRAGARAIRTTARLDAAASSRATSPLPTGYFTTVDGQEPLWAGDILEGESEDEYAARAATAKADFLASWATARQGSATAFIPAGLVYNVVQESARDTQLAEERQHAVLETARAGGLDAEFLNANPPGDSNTYANVQDKKLDRLDTVAEYMTAIQDRLSMEDVTPRGTVVRFDTTGFLQADEKSRMEAYVVAREAGAYGPEEVRRREELPASSAPSPAATVRPLRALPAREEAPVAATGDGTLALEADASTFGFETDEGRLAFEVDQESRTIYGLAVPFGVTARKNGRRFQFSRGSIRLPQDHTRVKLLVQHDRSQAIGRAVEFSEDGAGLWAKFKVARGPEGDRALALAADGVWDGLSIGLDAEAQFQADRAGVHHLTSGPLREVSLTPDPAYDDARVSSVAAEADDLKGNAMSGNETGTDTSTPATEPGAPTQTPAAPAPTFDTGQAAQFQAFQAWQAWQASQTGQPAPETFHVPAAGHQLIEVTEESPYRFEAGRGFISGGQFDFSGDLKRAADGDYAAKSRVLGWVGEAFEAAEGITFDIDQADGATLNPTRQRPDLYVGQKAYEFPLWAAVRKETISDNSTLTIPKRNTSTINVSAHTEGVEPTGASATWTSQTVTPTAVSGKVEITRELWDQGGNPRVSNLIWGEMVARYYEALEARVVTVLDAATPTAIALTAGGGTTGQTLSAELAAAFAALQFVRGGFSMDTFAAQIDLYKAITGALDDTGRPLFPILGPTNANGTSQPRFRTVNVHGVQAIPSWALAATGSVVASSYLFDRNDIWAAASAPQRLEFQYRVAYVDLAIWGYGAAAITDVTGVREVTYDPVA